MYLIFDILDIPLKGCTETLLSPNKISIAKLVEVFLILATRRWVQLACQEAKFNVIYSVSVIELAIELFFVLWKHIVSLEMVNIYPQIDFQSIGSEVWFISAKAFIFSFLEIPV